MTAFSTQGRVPFCGARWTRLFKMERMSTKWMGLRRFHEPALAPRKPKRNDV